jgi:hypothetical protein
VVIAAYLDCPAGAGVAGQAESVREQLAAVAVPSRAAELLDVNRAAGRVGLLIDLAGLFAPGPRPHRFPTEPRRTPRSHRIPTDQTTSADTPRHDG